MLGEGYGCYGPLAVFAHLDAVMQVGTGSSKQEEGEDAEGDVACVAHDALHWGDVTVPSGRFPEILYNPAKRLSTFLSIAFN